MVDSIGRKKIGDMRHTGRKRKYVIARVRTKMCLWRDAARLSLLARRKRLKAKVMLNKAQTMERKKEREKNPNPSFFSLMPESPLSSDNPLRSQLGYSTVPRKPKYSHVEPAPRLYGLRLRKI